jgi:predicted acetyltransferase
MSIYLKIPDTTDREKVADYVQEFRIESPEHINGAFGLVQSKSYEDWIVKVKKDISNPDIGQVRATQYIGIRETDGKVIGVIQLRHQLNDFLLNFGGHIGYSVRPSERRKGYASTMLQLCLAEAKNLNINRVLITCDEDNVGSAAVIENAGGVLEDVRDADDGTRKKRYWITLS